MENSEFFEAIDAYLAGKANSWQEFFLEDYFDSFSHCFNILDTFHDSEIKELGERMFIRIMEKTRT